MIARAIGWGLAFVVTVAIAWLWPRLGNLPSDFEIAMAYLEEDQPRLALLFLEDPEWRGVAAYRAGRYAQAAREFTAEEGTDETISSVYNLGNSLARLHNWDKAIAAYQRVLRFDPTHADATFNLALVRRAAGPPPEAPLVAMAEPDAAETQEGEQNEETTEQQTSPQSTQARESEQSDEAGNTSDTDESGEWDGTRAKPDKTAGETGTAGAVGETADERDGDNNKMVGSVDLKPRESTHPAEMLLRKILDDPEKVLRARLVSAHEARIMQEQK